jgi:hypothetical protein
MSVLFLYARYDTVLYMSRINNGKTGANATSSAEGRVSAALVATTMMMMMMTTMMMMMTTAIRPLL